MTEIEEWRPVIGYEGFYEVSSLGRVKRLIGGSSNTFPGKILKPDSCKPKHGYRIHFCKDGKERSFMLGRIVLEAFVGPRPANHECNHKDFDTSNNRASNLEWATHYDNIRWSTDAGRMVRGIEHPQSKLDPEAVRNMRQRYATGNVTLRILAEDYSVSGSVVYSVVTRRTWRWVD